MDTVTKTVKRMYERYPYPGYGVPSFGSRNHDLEQILAIAGRVRNEITGLRVLDAGCGTGDKTVGCALMYPEARINAFDLSSTSLEQAVGISERAGCENVGFFKGDIMNLRLGEQTYDVVITMGVVMLLSDPVKGLSNLTAALAPDGLCSLYLYNTAGRSEVIRIQRAVDLLNPDSNDLENRLNVATTLASQLQGSPHYEEFMREMNYLSERFRGADPSSNTARIVDQLAHVNERTYTLEEAFDLLDSAGLEFVGMVDSDMWQVDDYLDDGTLKERARSLGAREHHQLIESLRGPLHEHRMIARRNGSAPGALEPLELSDKDRPVMRRSLLRKSVQFLHSDLQSHESPMVGFVHSEQRFALSPAMMRLLECCDGDATIEALSLRFECPKHEIRTSIGRLISMGMVRLRPLETEPES